MKLLNKCLILITSFFFIFVLTGCVIEEENKKEPSFTTDFKILGESADEFQCALSIFPVDAYFKTDVKVEEILFEEDLKDAKDVLIDTNTKELIELTFNLPSNNQSVDEYQINGIIKLVDGVLVNSDGEAFSAVAKYEKYSHLDNVYQTSETIISSMTKIKLVHDGIYVAKFYVTWDEITEWSDLKYPYNLLTDEFYELPYEEMIKYGTPTIVSHSWEENGKKQTKGMEEEIEMGKNAQGVINVKVRAEVSTGLVWNPWEDICTLDVTGQSVEINVSGTTLNTKYDCKKIYDFGKTVLFDEVYEMTDFKYEETENNTMLCKVQLKIKEEYKSCMFVDRITIVTTYHEKQTTQMYLSFYEPSISYEFEIPIEKWSDQPTVLKICIENGIERWDEPLKSGNEHLSVLVP